MRTTYCFLLFILIATGIYSQTPRQEMPLAIGTKWLYKFTKSGSIPQYSYYTWSSVTKDTLVGSKRYYYVVNFWGDSVNCWIRFDDYKGSLIRYNPPYFSECGYEESVLRINSMVGDTETTCSQSKYTCTKVNDTTLFGTNSYLKEYFRSYQVYYCFHELNYKFLRGVGLYYQMDYTFCRTGYITQRQMLGAVINGVVFGDTTIPAAMTDEIISSESIPNKYFLEQNYPNPFNPSTQISFDIPVDSDARLVIYDASGKEISQLINANLKAGHHSAVWNASAYPSGVYFYKLTAGEFSQTEKMVLIK